mgnify:CR=1 FL=1|jgi:hypothetical protein
MTKTSAIGSNNENTDTYIRIDENWTTTTEELALEWLKNAKTASKKHYNSGIKNKFKHRLTGLPAMLLPAIFAPLTVALAEVDGVQWVSMGGFIATAFFSTINNFFEYSKMHQKHMDSSSRYSDLVSDIKYELAKERKYRQPPDVILTKIQLKLDYLDESTPDI